MKRRSMTGYKSEKQAIFESHTLGHMDRLHRYGVHLTGNVHDADDLVQETYLKAFRFWDSCDPETNIRAWLYRILKNTFINRYRSEQRRGISVEYVDAVDPGRGSHRGEPRPTAQNTAFDTLLDDDVAAALSELPHKFRTVLILSDIEGMTYDEIAGFLDCPLGTVRSRLHRARQVLRQALGSYAADRGYGERASISAAGP
jgi:RNA polymerase sigma-70 factor (ECF subfamily)